MAHDGKGHEWKDWLTDIGFRPLRSERFPSGGISGEGDYYHIALRPAEQFTVFRTQDMGRDGQSLRVSAKKPGAGWVTQKWLVRKIDAHVEGNYLVADDPKVKRILTKLGGMPRRIEGDRFAVRSIKRFRARVKRAGVKKASPKKRVANKTKRSHR